MTKTTQPTYVASAPFGAGGVWGSDAVSTQAIDRCKKEAKVFASSMGGFSDKAKVRINVVRIPAGHYWKCEDGSHYFVDYDTDQIAGYAEPVECILWTPKGDTMTADYAEVQRWGRAVQKANAERYPDA